jgi:hypothetical protein
VSILYGLGQGAVTLASLNIANSFTGTIGLPEMTPSGYAEYRLRYLDIIPTIINIGYGAGNGSGRIKIETGGILTTVLVSGRGTRAESALPCVLLKDTGANSVITIGKGDVGISTFPADPGAVLTLEAGWKTNQASDVYCEVGSAVTLGTVEQSGGQLLVDCDVVTKVDMTGGTYTQKSGALPLVNCDGGIVYYESTGTLASAIIGNGGILDFTRDLRTREVTACELHHGSSYKDPFGTVSIAGNVIKLHRCNPSNLRAFEIAAHRTLTITAIA